MTRPRDRFGRPLPRGRPDELRAGPPPRCAAEAQGQGIRLFDRQRFFESHECFELLWKSVETPDDDRRFWKGLTQVAAGCCHVQRGNAAGAVALLERALGYLRGYPSPFRGIDTRRVRADVAQLARAVHVEGISRSLRFPQLSSRPWFPRSDCPRRP